MPKRHIEAPVNSPIQPGRPADKRATTVINIKMVDTSGNPVDNPRVLAIAKPYLVELGGLHNFATACLEESQIFSGEKSSQDTAMSKLLPLLLASGAYIRSATVKREMEEEVKKKSKDEKQPPRSVTNKVN